MASMSLRLKVAFGVYGESLSLSQVLASTLEFSFQVENLYCSVVFWKKSQNYLKLFQFRVFFRNSFKNAEHI